MLFEAALSSALLRRANSHGLATWVWGDAGGSGGKCFIDALPTIAEQQTDPQDIKIPCYLVIALHVLVSRVSRRLSALPRSRVDAHVQAPAPARTRRPGAQIAGIFCDSAGRAWGCHTLPAPPHAWTEVFTYAGGAIFRSSYIGI
jgi:hypothetical protein